MNYSNNAWDTLCIIKDDYDLMSGCGIGPLSADNLAVCLDLPYVTDALILWIDWIISMKLVDLKKFQRDLSSMTLDEAIANSLAI